MNGIPATGTRIPAPKARGSKAQGSRALYILGVFKPFKDGSLLTHVRQYIASKYCFKNIYETRMYKK